MHSMTFKQTKCVRQLFSDVSKVFMPRIPRGSSIRFDLRASPSKYACPWTFPIYNGMATKARSPANSHPPLLHHGAATTLQPGASHTLGFFLAFPRALRLTNNSRCWRSRHLVCDGVVSHQHERWNGAELARITHDWGLGGWMVGSGEQAGQFNEVTARHMGEIWTRPTTGDGVAARMIL